MWCCLGLMCDVKRMKKLVAIDLIPKNADGSVKMVSMEAVSPATREQTTIQAPDYSAFYDIDRLSAEVNAWYEKKGMED